MGKRGQTPFCRSLLRLIDMKGKQNGSLNIIILIYSRCLILHVRGLRLVNMNNQMLIRLFEFAKKGRYPSLLAELAESFGMMLVKVEAREFERSEIIEELEKAKAKLEDYSQGLEKHLEECCPEE